MQLASKRIVIGLGALAALLVLAGVAAWLWALNSLPETQGEATLPGLEAPVEVLRDSDGLVTIRAGSLHDAYAALGYVHAQDRLWQMDLMRRLAAGRISAIFGDGTFRHDRFMRTLGLEESAKAQWQAISSAARADIEAYARGVNGFLETHRGALPPEFTVLGYSPEDWKPHHSLLWGKLMALQLSGNFAEEIARARLLQKLPADKVAFLWPDYENDTPIVDSARAAAIRQLGLDLGQLADLLPWSAQPKSASNSWVLDGRFTETGLPLLANDPHLGLNVPGTWYLARIETPELTLAGATSPGIPYHPIGHNRHAAWGFTTTHSDTQDLFIERLTDDGNGYLTPEGPRMLERRMEEITVRGEDTPRRIDILKTRHGPVISGAHRGAEALRQEAQEPDDVLALAWPALGPDDRSPDALRGINRARDWTAFLAALSDFHAPHQNIVFADRSGNIGLAAVARVPLRKRGDGTVPVPGWSGEYDWHGFVPLSELPIIANPPSGRIVAANNKLVGRDYPYLLSAQWPPPARARRIEALLDEKPGPFTVDAFAAMQMDAYSRIAAQVLPALLRELSKSDEQTRRQARDLLEDWDFVMRRDQPAPLIYMAWLRQLHASIFSDDLGAAFDAYGKPNPLVIRDVFVRNPSWCDDIDTEAVEDCQAISTAAFAQAVMALQEAYGGSPPDWRWGDAHRAAFAHPIFARVPVLGEVANFALATDGGEETVNRGGVSWRAPNPFEHRHGPGMRAVFDLGDLDNSRFIIATGQAGHPLAEHYGNFAKRWRDGVFVKLVGDTTEDTRRLTLNPR